MFGWGFLAGYVAGSIGALVGILFFFASEKDSE